MEPITVYAINLPERTERLKSIKREFTGKKEFRLSIIPSIRHDIGAFGQWLTFINIVRCEAEKKSDYFVFCEDDHVFTHNYDYNTFFEYIMEANKMEADILCGGVGYLEDPIQCSDRLFWINSFNGMQFIVIYNRFYDKILMADTNTYQITDYFISNVSDRIFVCYPFISVQKEFGYSDITNSNKQKGHLRKCFHHSEKTIQRIIKIKQFYSNHYEIR